MWPKYFDLSACNKPGGESWVSLFVSEQLVKTTRKKKRKILRNILNLWKMRFTVQDELKILKFNLIWLQNSKTPNFGLIRWWWPQLKKMYPFKRDTSLRFDKIRFHTKNMVKKVIQLNISRQDFAFAMVRNIEQTRLR